MTTLFQDLKEEIAKRQCIVIVGAGVSISSTRNAPCASWTGLLRDGVKRCTDLLPNLPAGWDKRALEDIDSGDLDGLLASAEKISSKLGAPQGGEYSRWLRESVGHLTIENAEILSALKALGAVIATTNYDNLIEEITGLPAITWQDGTRVERVLRGDEQAILHLHGHYQAPESVILGIRSYDQILGNEHAQTMQRAIASLKTLLFVGCGDGLHDPNFGALLQWTGKVFSGSEYRRFRLARSGEVSDLQKQHPAEQRLFVLDYGKNHNDLAPYLRSLAPPPISPATAPAPAPTPARLPSRPRCIGRDEEYAAIIAALLAATPEPLPILGPPGIGKTNLALSAAHDNAIAARYGARRYFVRCDGLRSRSDIAAALANVLGIGLGTHNEAAALIALESAPSLLILDNAETPWEADTLGVEEFLGRLADIPDLALIVTIRGNQRPQGVCWREPFRPDPLSQDSARELFLTLAGRQFANDTNLAPLLAAVDHVPLAITLLAPLAEGEPDLTNLWQRWQDERTAMLKRADAKDRLTNIELSYELSWSGPRMNDTARQFLQRLAHLPAGVAHSNIKSILPTGMQAATILRQTALAHDEDERLRVLAPLRDYVLKCHPLEAPALEELAGHYVVLTAQLGAKVGQNGGDAASISLTIEAPNIEPMLMQALSADKPIGAINAAEAWGSFVSFSGVGHMEPLKRAADVAQKIGYKFGEARCRLTYARLAYKHSDSEMAHQQCQAALALYQKERSATGQAGCVFMLGEIESIHSDINNASRHYQSALSLYRKGKNLTGEAECMHRLGNISLRRSQYELAGRQYEQALVLYKKRRSSLGLAHCYRALGTIAANRAQYNHASQHCQAALSLYQQVGDIVGEANCISDLGDIAMAEADHEKANELYRRARLLYKKTGELVGEANCTKDMGNLAMRQVDLEPAQRYLEAAQVIYKQVKEPVGEAGCINGLGNIALKRNDLCTARQRYDAALVLYQKVESAIGQGNCYFGMARVHKIQGNIPAAKVAVTQALTYYERDCHPYPIGAAHALLAQFSEGEEQNQHRTAARNAWMGLDAKALTTWAALDGLDPAEVMEEDFGRVD